MCNILFLPYRRFYYSLTEFHPLRFGIY